VLEQPQRGGGDSLVGRVLDGRYRVERLVGNGGMGAVYLATQLAVERDVAVKVLRRVSTDEEAAQRRFEREARTVSRLTSPHTVVLHDFGTLPEGARYMVMEYLEGRTLAERLEEGRPALDEALEVVRAIAESLAEAHALGIVHRDLKPANVMLCSSHDGVRVKVLDFGIAAWRDADAPASEATPGTPGYIAPEALAGTPADARADVYALGVILYEMLAGRRLFDDTSSSALLHAQLHDDPAPLRELAPDAPDALRKLCHRCIAREPRLRPRDAREVLAELDRAATDGDTAVTAAEPARLLVRPETSEPVAAKAAEAAHAEGAAHTLASPSEALRTRADQPASSPRGLVVAVLALLVAGAALFFVLRTPPAAETHAAPTPTKPAPHVRTPADIARLEKLSVDLIDRFSKGAYDAMTPYLDEATRVAWPLPARQRTWEALVAQLGPLRSIGKPRSTPYEDHYFVFVELVFANATCDFKLVFGENDSIVGVFFTNALPLPSASAG
jgi:tRNA A-37 threonylcarbamoyl transferase component Bud32